VLKSAEVPDAALARLGQVGLRQIWRTLKPEGSALRRQETAGVGDRAGRPVGETGARLLLLDEPAAGLAATERADLMARLIQSLARKRVWPCFTPNTTWTLSSAWPTACWC
jgi:ABC-type branched-subunit amino acid transport system ATPase component